MKPFQNVGVVNFTSGLLKNPFGVLLRRPEADEESYLLSRTTTAGFFATLRMTAGGVFQQAARAQLPFKTIIAGLMVFFMAGCDWSTRKPEISFSPDHPAQGDTLRIVATHVSPKRSYDCVFDKKIVPLFPLENGDLRGLVGLNAEFIPAVYALELRERGPWGKVRSVQVDVGVRKKTFRKENISLPLNKTMLTQDPLHMEAKGRISAVLSSHSSVQLWDGVFGWPAAGEMSSAYGTKRIVNKKESRPYHKGIDIRAPLKTVVRAANRGKVVLAEAFPVQGKMIILDHGQGVMTTYLHLHSIEVKKGDTVEKNQVIARVGSEGFSTGPHLHFGHYVRGEPVDPWPWMKNIY